MKKEILFAFVSFCGFLFFSSKSSPISLTISNQEGVQILKLFGENSEEDLTENLFLENIEMDFLQGENESSLIAAEGFWRKAENVFFLKDITLFSFENWSLSASQLDLDILKNEIKTDSFFEINYGKATISGSHLNLKISNFSGTIGKNGVVVMQR